jgi:hypothetical protein
MGSNREPHWKFVESVAALIERTLDRSAEIGRNQKLPSLKVPGARRECDVTVRTGPPNRRTLSLVEVQKRRRKVDPTTFDGWCEKMREVGAQHLICVSAKGFPRSVVAKAALLGPTVRLATLQELEQRLVSSLGLRSFTVELNRIEQISRVELLAGKAQYVRGGGTIEFGERHFRDGAGELLSLSEIATRELHLTPNDRKNAHGIITRWITTDSSFDFLPNPDVGRVRLRFMVTVLLYKDDPPLEYVEYKQIGDPSACTWVMTARVAPTPTDEGHTVQLVFRPQHDGRLVPDTLAVSGLAPGHRISARFESVKNADGSELQQDPSSQGG